jgi:type I restriction enzyme S subunit
MPSSQTTQAFRPLSFFLREPLRNGHSASASSDPNGIRTLTLTAVTVGDFSERNTKITSADTRRVKDLWLEPGDILIQRSNAPELVGTSRLYRGDRNYAIFPDLMIRVRLNEGADPRFIELVLQSEPLRQYFKSRAKGMSGSMPKIDQETISEAPIPLFDIDDQRRIVAEIEKQFTRLEAGVAALRRVQANLKRYRAAVLKAACEGRLVPTESELARAEGRPFESGQQHLARILIERRQNWQGRGKYKEPICPSESGYEPDEPPEGWTWATVSEVSAVIVDCPHSTAKFVSEGHPCLDTTCMKPGRVVREKLRYVAKATFDERVERLVPETNDIVFAREGTVGTAVAIPADLRPCLGQRVMLMRPDACILPAYFQHCLNSETVRRQYLPKIVGSTAPHINVAEVKMLAIPLPPLAEQTRIVAEVERRLSVVEELEAVVTTNLQRATRLRQSILQKAFNGELG